MNNTEFERKFSTSILETEVTHKEVEKFIEKCKKYNLYGIAVDLDYVVFAKKLLEGTSMKVITVASYPNGGMTTKVKVAQIKYAIKMGADEIDACLNYNALKSGRFDDVKNDMNKMVDAAENKIKLIFIPQFAILTNEEKIKVCDLSIRTGCNVIKTNTGYGYNTIVEDILIAKRIYGSDLEVEASGGCRTREQAKQILNAGSSVIHTSTIFNILQ